MFKNMFSKQICIVCIIMMSITLFASQESENSNVLERIFNAYKNGEIDYATALENRVYAIIDQSRLDNRFSVKAGEVIKCGTPYIEEYAINKDKLSAKSRSLIDGLLEQSQEHDDKAEYYTSPSGHFYIKYYTSTEHSVPLADNNDNGIPDYVETAGDVLDNCWTVETVDLLFDPPKVNTVAPTDKQNVYIEKLSSGVMGYVQGVDNLHLSNDYGQWGDELENMQVTSAHEFNHEIQLSYHYPAHPSTWYMECTSMWCEDKVYDHVNDYLGYLYSWYTTPWISLTDDTDHWYSTSIWNFYLDEKFYVDIIREIWDDPNTNKLTGIINVLEANGTTIYEEFDIFETWNYFTSYRANWGHDTFSEAGLFNAAVSHTRTHTFTSSITGVYDETVSASKYPEGFACNYLKFANSGSDGILVVQIQAEEFTKFGGYAITDSAAEHFCRNIPIVYDEEEEYGIVIIPTWTDLNSVIVVPTNLATSHAPRSYTYTAEVVDAVVFLSDFSVAEVSGNMNGSLEADETGSLSVTVSNFGTQIDNASLEIITDNSNITINNGTYDIGVFPENSEVGNSAAPFTFTLAHVIEPQEVVMTLIIKDNGINVTSSEIRFNIGFSPVLFVDDDNGNDDNDVLVEILDNMGLVYEYRNVFEDGLDNLNLALRDKVIWSVGDETSQLTTEKLEIIKSAFDANTNLLVTGTKIGAKLETTDWCPVISEGSFNGGLLGGVDGDFVSEIKDNWILTSVPSGGNEFMYTNGDPRAIISFPFYGQDGGGIIRYRENGRSAFANISFSSITTPNDNFLTPTQLFTMLYDFFEDANDLPENFGITSPETGFSVTITESVQEVNFQWETSSDADDVTYTLAFGVNSDFTGGFFYEVPGIVNTEYTLSMSEIIPLFDTKDDELNLYWGVYASDGKEVRLSNVMNGITFIDNLPNLSPTQFSLLYPAFGENLNISKSDTSFTFAWGASTDPEEQEITYSWKLSLDNMFTEPVFRTETLTDTTIEIIADTLLSWIAEDENNLNLWWTVSVTDQVNVTLSDTVEFLVVDNIDLPPLDFDLISPDEDFSGFEITDVDDSLEFTWSQSVDPEGKEISYRFVARSMLCKDEEYAIDTTFSDTSLILFGSEILEVFFRDNPWTDNFTWNVIASDDSFEVAAIETGWGFPINNMINIPPENFDLINPADNDTLRLSITMSSVRHFIWNQSYDANIEMFNQDSLDYTLTLYTGIGEDTTNIFHHTTKDTIYSFIPGNLLALMDSSVTMDVNWFVTASDGEFNVDSDTHFCFHLIDLDNVSIESGFGELPASYKLYDNYPNPFNPTTNIKFDLPKRSFVKLSIYDVLGNRVQTIVNEEKHAGTYIVNWNGLSEKGTQMPTGMYLYRIETNSFISYKKMLLIK